MAYPSTSNNDPNRMYYGKVGKRNPWFIGYTNRQTPTPGRFISSVQRYGLRGANGLRTWATNRDSLNPENNIGDSTPDFLRDNSFVNEWTPTVRAHPVEGGRTSSSAPRLWPKDSEFPTGFLDSRPATCVKPRKVIAQLIELTGKKNEFKALTRSKRAEQGLGTTHDQIFTAKAPKGTSSGSTVATYAPPPPWVAAGVLPAGGPPRGGSLETKPRTASSKSGHRKNAAKNSSSRSTSFSRSSTSRGLRRNAELDRSEREALKDGSVISALTKSWVSGSKLGGSIEGGASLQTSGGQITRATTANSITNVKVRGDPRYGRIEKYGEDVAGMRYSGANMVLTKTQIPTKFGERNAAELRHALRKQMIWQLYGFIYADQAAHSPKQVAHDLAEIFKAKKDSRVADHVLVKRDVFIEVIISEVKDYTEMMAFRLFSLFDVYNHGKIEYAVPLAMLVAICDHGLSVEQRIVDLWNFFNAYLEGRSEVNIFRHIFMSCCYSVEQEGTMNELLKTEFRPMFYEYQSYFGLYDDGGGGGGGGDMAATAALLAKDTKSSAPKEAFNHEDLLNLCKQCPRTLAFFDREMTDLLKSLHHDTKEAATQERAELRQALRRQRQKTFRAQPSIKTVTSTRPGVKI